MTSHEYAEAMSKVRAMRDGRARYEAWRAVKSARQLYLDHRRKARDPDWYAAKLAKVVAYKRRMRDAAAPIA